MSLECPAGRSCETAEGNRPRHRRHLDLRAVLFALRPKPRTKNDQARGLAYDCYAHADQVAEAQVAEARVAAQVARWRSGRPRPTTAVTGVLMWTRVRSDQGILCLACSI